MVVSGIVVNHASQCSLGSSTRPPGREELDRVIPDEHPTQRSVMTFHHGGVQICRETFLKLHGIGKTFTKGCYTWPTSGLDRFKNLKASYLASGLNIEQYTVSVSSPRHWLGKCSFTTPSIQTISYCNTSQPRVVAHVVELKHPCTAVNSDQIVLY